MHPPSQTKFQLAKTYARPKKNKVKRKRRRILSDRPSIAPCQNAIPHHNESIFNSDHSLRDDYWMDEFDLLAQGRTPLRKGNVIRKDVRADYNRDSSFEGSPIPLSPLIVSQLISSPPDADSPFKVPARLTAKFTKRGVASTSFTESPRSGSGQFSILAKQALLESRTSGNRSIVHNTPSCLDTSLDKVCENVLTHSNNTADCRSSSYEKSTIKPKKTTETFEDIVIKPIFFKRKASGLNEFDDNSPEIVSLRSDQSNESFNASRVSASPLNILDNSYPDVLPEEQSFPSKFPADNTGVQRQETVIAGGNIPPSTEQSYNESSVASGLFSGEHTNSQLSANLAVEPNIPQHGGTDDINETNCSQLYGIEEASVQQSDTCDSNDIAVPCTTSDSNSIHPALGVTHLNDFSIEEVECQEPATMTRLSKANNKKDEKSVNNHKSKTTEFALASNETHIKHIKSVPVRRRRGRPPKIPLRMTPLKNKKNLSKVKKGVPGHNSDKTESKQTLKEKNAGNGKISQKNEVIPIVDQITSKDIAKKKSSEIILKSPSRNDVLIINEESGKENENRKKLSSQKVKANIKSNEKGRGNLHLDKSDKSNERNANNEIEINENLKRSDVESKYFLRARTNGLVPNKPVAKKSNSTLGTNRKRGRPRLKTIPEDETLHHQAGQLVVESNNTAEQNVTNERLPPSPSMLNPTESVDVRESNTASPSQSSKQCSQKTPQRSLEKLKKLTSCLPSTPVYKHLRRVKVKLKRIHTSGKKGNTPTSQIYVSESQETERNSTLMQHLCHDDFAPHASQESDFNKNVEISHVKKLTGEVSQQDKIDNLVTNPSQIDHEEDSHSDSSNDSLLDLPSTPIWKHLRRVKVKQKRIHASDKRRKTTLPGESNAQNTTNSQMYVSESQETERNSSLMQHHYHEDFAPNAYQEPNFNKDAEISHANNNRTGEVSQQDLIDYPVTNPSQSEDDEDSHSDSSNDSLLDLNSYSILMNASRLEKSTVHNKTSRVSQGNLSSLQTSDVSSTYPNKEQIEVDDVIRKRKSRLSATETVEDTFNKAPKVHTSDKYPELKKLRINLKRAKILRPIDECRDFVNISNIDGSNKLASGDTAPKEISNATNTSGRTVEHVDGANQPKFTNLRIKLKRGKILSRLDKCRDFVNTSNTDESNKLSSKDTTSREIANTTNTPERTVDPVDRINQPDLKNLRINLKKMKLRSRLYNSRQDTTSREISNATNISETTVAPIDCISTAFDHSKSATNTLSKTVRINLEATTISAPNSNRNSSKSYQPTPNQTIATPLQRSLDDSIDRDDFIAAISRNATQFVNKSNVPLLSISGSFRDESPILSPRYMTPVGRRSSILAGSAVPSLIAKLCEIAENQIDHEENRLAESTLVLPSGKWRKALSRWQRTNSMIADKTSGTLSANTSANINNHSTSISRRGQQLKNYQNSPTTHTSYMLLSSRGSSVLRKDNVHVSNVESENLKGKSLRNSKVKTKSSAFSLTRPEPILEHHSPSELKQSNPTSQQDNVNVLLLEPTDDEAPNLQTISLLESAVEQNLHITSRSLQKDVESATRKTGASTTVADIINQSYPRRLFNETDSNEYHRQIYQHQLSVPVYRQPSIPRRRRTSVIERSDDHSIIPIPTSGSRQRHLNGAGDGSDENLHYTDYVHIPYERRGILSTSLSPRDRVLRRCNQFEPLDFSIVYSENVLRHCRKIGEGVYGEVFMNKTVRGEAVVLKIIPIEGSIEVNGEPQKTFEQILSEIIIAMELSRLRDDEQFMTSGFVDVKKVCCVQGRYPDHLIDLWELYRDNCGTENDHPEIFPEDQIYIVLELANGGQDLEAFTFQNAIQSSSAFAQTALTLAIAEQKFQFEHRDLHWGNILLAPTDEPTIVFRLNGEEIKVPSHGVKATIIDYTLSRMVYNGCCLYNDLSNDSELFLAGGDYQFDIYRLMKQHLKNQWTAFEPYTNILWLHYTIDKMISGARYRCSKSKKHRSVIHDMMQLRDGLLDFKSASDYVECLK